MQYKRYINCSEHNSSQTIWLYVKSYQNSREATYNVISESLKNDISLSNNQPMHLVIKITISTTLHYSLLDFTGTVYKLK